MIFSYKKYILLILTYIIFSQHSLALNNNLIYIYADDGTCAECVYETETSLKELLEKEYIIRKITAKDIINNKLNNASLFIMPGGKASLYAQKLNGEANKYIKNFINHGASYLGICAGAYYGGKNVEFAQGTKLEKISQHELELFPAKIIGPALKPYDEESDSGICSAKIKYYDNNRENNSIIYYNGGGYFENANFYENIQVLGSYNDLNNKAALIEIKIGRGKAILSGIHFEFSADKLRKANRNKNLDWSNIEKSRKKLFKFCINKLL